MQFFNTLAIAAVAALAMVVKSNPIGAAEAEIPANSFMTEAQLDKWIENTDFELSFMGLDGVRTSENPRKAPGANLAEMERFNTRVVYCSRRVNNTCNSPCTVYDGPPACISAPDTSCIQGSRTFRFCSTNNCNNPCTDSNNCIEWLSNNFCYTPDTRSIRILS